MSDDLAHGILNAAAAAESDRRRPPPLPTQESMRLSYHIRPSEDLIIYELQSSLDIGRPSTVIRVPWQLHLAVAAQQLVKMVHPQMLPPPYQALR